MTRFAFVLGLGLAAALAPAASAAPAKKAAAPVARDWSKTVAMTPAGGFRMGNPAAKVKLVEYGSMTCPHCAQFANEDEARLVAKYVKSGKVAFEFRNYVMNPYDIAASLTARCGGAPRFFGITHRLYSTQKDWIGAIQATDAGKMQAIGALPPGQQVAAIADLAGFTRLAASHGIPAARLKACLASQKNLDQLVAMRNAASFVEGTPTFLINGTKVAFTNDGTLWQQLDSKIGAALK